MYAVIEMVIGNIAVKFIAAIVSTGVIVWTGCYNEISLLVAGLFLLGVELLLDVVSWAVWELDHVLIIYFLLISH